METIWDSHLNEKLRILADAAKYDAACTSSGVDRKNGSMGTCLLYTSDAADEL